MFVVQYGGGGRPEKFFSSVVWNSWRLVSKDELYDISKDSGQQHNLSKDYPEVLNRMRSFYDDWWKKIEPGIDKFIPLVIGSDHENPITLTSDFWANGNYVNTQWKVAQAVGDKKGGVWHVSVEKGGKYKLELSRWPFHLNRQLTRIGPDTAIGGIKIRAGKAIPVKSGSLSLNGKAPIIERASYLATKISMIVEIPPGDNTLQAWFSNEDGNAVCGAYYLRVTRIF